MKRSGIDDFDNSMQLIKCSLVETQSIKTFEICLRFGDHKCICIRLLIMKWLYKTLSVQNLGLYLNELYIIPNSAASLAPRLII